MKKLLISILLLMSFVIHVEAKNFNNINDNINYKEQYADKLENSKLETKYLVASYDKEQTVVENPQTGDGITLIVFGVVLFLVGIGIVIMIIKED